MSWQGFLTGTWGDGPLLKFNKTLRCSLLNEKKKITIFLFHHNPEELKRNRYHLYKLPNSDSTAKVQFWLSDLWSNTPAMAVHGISFLCLRKSSRVFSWLLCFIVPWPDLQSETLLTNPLAQNTSTEYYLLELPHLK